MPFVLASINGPLIREPDLVTVTLSVLDVLHVRMAGRDDGNGRSGEIVRFSSSPIWIEKHIERVQTQLRHRHRECRRQPTSAKSEGKRTGVADGSVQVSDDNRAVEVSESFRLRRLSFRSPGLI